MDMEEILDTVLEKDEPEVVAEKTLEELGQFKFSDTKDKAGLPVEDKSYVKRSCKDCYGRGYQIQSFGGRRYQTCACVNRGYVKARREHETKLARIKKAVEGLNRQVTTVDAIVAAREAQK